MVGTRAAGDFQTVSQAVYANDRGRTAQLGACRGTQPDRPLREPRNSVADADAGASCEPSPPSVPGAASHACSRSERTPCHAIQSDTRWSFWTRSRIESRGRISVLFPYRQEKSTERFRQVLVLPTEFGRRDWTRTNDPHHVKVVL